MKTYGLVAILAVAALAGCGDAPTMTKITCSKADVLVSQEQLATILNESGASPKEICAVVDTIDTAGFAEATDVAVTMPSGKTYTLQLQSLPL